MRKRAKRRFASVLKGLLAPVIILAVLLFFFTGISNLRGGSDDQGRRQLEESIRRCAAACYAAEGIYPPTVEYMEENYGLQVDRSRYYIDYIVFAENLMPDFTVLEAAEDAPEGTGTGSGNGQGSI